MRASPFRSLSPAVLLALATSLTSACAASKSYAPSGYDGAVAEVAADEGGGLFGDFMGADREEAPAMAMNAPAPPPPPPPPMEPSPALPTDPSDARSDGKPDDKPVEANKRLVIYTGNMSLMVVDADAALGAFVDDVTAGGGYLQSRSASTVTVRVPAPQFFETLAKLRQRGTVLDENVNAQDVTKQVFDIELRLQTAEESRKRLVAILQAATKIEDILRIENEIRRLTQEIEGMKSQLRNLGDQIAFSTLTVSFSANAPSPRRYPERTRSRFDWINQIGVEQVLGGF